MSPDGWIEHKDSEGNQAVTYDAEVETVEQAKAKGYTDVKQVVAETTATNNINGDEIKLNKDGTYSVNGGDAVRPSEQIYKTEGGAYIDENITSFQQGTAIVQGIGDGITALGTVTAQPEIVAVGETISKVGLIAEVAYDFANNGINNETVKNAGIKVGLYMAFSALGDAGVNATRTVAGKKAVEAGENVVSESIIQGATMVGEKATNEIINKRN